MICDEVREQPDGIDEDAEQEKEDMDLDPRVEASKM